VAYWYDGGRPTMQLTDGVDVGVPVSEQNHRYAAKGGLLMGETKARFDGDQSQYSTTMMRGAGRRGQSAERFVIHIDPKNQGVLLRRLYLQLSGRQRAQLLIDGHPAGLMGTPDDNRVDRWRQEDIILPAALTAGRAQLTVELRPELGEWNSFRYLAWVLLPPLSAPPVSPGPEFGP
jgi:hypothetical protein